MIYDYKCDECGFTKEFIVSYSVVDNIPDVCPQCNKGKLVKQFSCSGQSFDVVGGYDYEYGKKAWQKKMNQVDQASVLTGGKDPY